MTDAEPIKRGTAVLWKCKAVPNKVELGVVKSVMNDRAEIEIIEPREEKTILVTVSCSELQPL